MSYKHFKPVPQDSTLSFGGYSFIDPVAWEAYLDQVIQEGYPDYFTEHLHGRWKDSPWREQESCILTSLESYLFHVFGIFIPDDNLFKVFNREGKGLELADMLEAISAVIEPLGLKIDLVLAADPEIRAALGESDRVMDEKKAGLVDGKPGLCMINVENGYNHAFFWPKINPRSVLHEKFRLMILVKRIIQAEVPQQPAEVVLHSFVRFFRDSIRLDFSESDPENRFTLEILLEIQELERFSMKKEQVWDEETRDRIDQHLVLMLEAYRNYSCHSSRMDSGFTKRSRTLLGAGQMIRKVIREGLQSQ